MWLDPGRDSYLDLLVRQLQIKEIQRAIQEEKETGIYSYPEHISKSRFDAMVKHVKKNGIH